MSEDYHSIYLVSISALAQEGAMFDQNAFVNIKLDIASVRRELISIYMFDELRRVVTETFIPYIMRKATEFKAKQKISKEKSFDVSESFDKVIDKKLIEIT